ncbi:hypothetical protein ACQPZZ_38800 [Microbispora sp. CA-135349]|uniref:hypothetical protein n=1 Tax=Microbispora sp. CA-135349 TaxID=3239953 RepID=UPI003D93727A
MNDDVIRRLQDAAHAVGETVEAVPPFNPAVAPARRTPAASWRANAWLLPVAAAAAVTVAVAGGAAVARHGGGTTDTAAGSTAGPAAEPSFLVEVRSGDMAVRSVADGHVTATVPGPEGERFTRVQATRDNRLFYAVTEQGGCRSRFYRFRLGDSGEVGSIGALPFTPPEGTAVTSLAVNGDGSTLAYGLSSCTPSEAGASLVVTDTATGDSRTWTSARAWTVRDVSMSEDGRTLAFRRAGMARVVSMKATPEAKPDEATTAPSASREPLLEEPAPRDSEVTAKPDRPAATVEPPGEEATARKKPRVKPHEPGTPFPIVQAPEAAPTPRERAVPSEPSAPPLPKGWTCVLPGGAAERPATGTTHGATEDAWECSASRTVWVLDTGTPGSLDDVRTITLGESSVATMGGVYDIALTPDGGRVLAAVSWGEPARTQGGTALAGAVHEVVAYDVGTGRFVRTLYRREDGRPPFEHLDLDGTGRFVLVVGPDETGQVTESGYHALFRDGGGSFKDGGGLFRDGGGVARPAAW